MDAGNVGGGNGQRRDARRLRYVPQSCVRRRLFRERVPYVRNYASTSSANTSFFLCHSSQKIHRKKIYKKNFPIYSRRIARQLCSYASIADRCHLNPMTVTTDAFPSASNASSVPSVLCGFATGGFAEQLGYITQDSPLKSCYPVTVAR